MFKRTLLGIAIAALPLAASALNGPVYPAPGGNTFASGTYSGFNTSAFSSLYWGADSTALPSAGLLALGIQSLSFSAISGTSAIWLSANPTNQVELIVNVTGLGANPWTPAASVTGLPSSVGAVIDDSAGVSFSRTLTYMINLGSGFVPLNNNTQGPCNPCTQNSFTGAFYYTPSAVPEPQSIVLGLAGLGFLGFAAARRKA